MANDRIILECTTCGAWKTMIKYYPNSGLTIKDTNTQEWVQSHYLCRSDIASVDLNNNTGFNLVTEDTKLDYSKLNKLGRSCEFINNKDGI